MKIKVITKIYFSPPFFCYVALLVAQTVSTNVVESLKYR